MADELVWEDPPPAKGGGGGGWRIAALVALKEHPGKWAIVKNRRKTGALSSDQAWFKQKGCEAVTRQQTDRNIALYARWPEVES